MPDTLPHVTPIRAAEMKRQLLHEHHNRQDKLHKSAYIEELRDRPPTYAYSPDSERLQAKHKARECEVQRLRGCRFFLNGHQFKFGWSLNQFAAVNGFAPAEPITKQAWDKAKYAATADMKNIAAAIMRGSVRRLQVTIKEEETPLKALMYTYSPDFETPKARREAEREAREHEINRIRKCRFIRNGHQFKFGWSLDQFATVNGLAVAELATKQAYDTIKLAARSDMTNIKTAITKGRVRQLQTCIKGVGQVALSALEVEWKAESNSCDEIKMES